MTANSCDITTFDDYFQLLLGEIGQDCENLWIHESAMDGTESILAQPINFVNAPYNVITFRAGEKMWKRSTIHMFPPKQAIAADFQSGHVLLRGLPTNYTDYEIVFGPRTALSFGDLKAIFSWTNAKKLAIYDESQHDMAQKIARKVEVLDQIWPELEELTLVMHDHTYAAVKIDEILTKLPALKSARFQYSRFVPTESREVYTLELQMPDGWQMSTENISSPYGDILSILCTKNTEE